MAKPFSPSHLGAIDAWRKGTDESDASLAARLGVSRQLISRWNAQHRANVAATGATVDGKRYRSKGIFGVPSPVGLDARPTDLATIPDASDLQKLRRKSS